MRAKQQNLVIEDGGVFLFVGHESMMKKLIPLEILQLCRSTVERLKAARWGEAHGCAE